MFAVGTSHICDAINCQDVSRIMRDNQKSAPLQDGARRECIVHIPADLKSAEVLNERIGIEQFDKLQVPPISPWCRMIHDLSDDQPAIACAWPQWLDRRRQQAHGASARITEIAELGECALRRVLAGNSETQIDGRRQGKGGGAELRPGLAIVTRVASEMGAPLAL